MTEKARSIQDRQEEIVEEFEFLGDWTERYRHIIDLGRHLPPLPEQRRTDEYKVGGCQSQIWLYAELVDGRVQFVADSDAHIVRGLIALLLECYSGCTPDEILESSPEFLDRLGLTENLSQTRARGLQFVLQRMKLYAKDLKERAGQSAP